MKALPWSRRPAALLTDIQVHADQLTQSRQPSTVRSALAHARFSARHLIRGARGTGCKERKFWGEVVVALREYRHQVRVYVRALNQMNEPTHAQMMRQP